jgi:DNA-binding NarL/FixJ family response regulator
MKKYRVLIVDDHPAIREGLKHIIDSEPDFKVVCEASSFQEAVRMISEIEIDLGLLDVSLPDGNGIELCRKIKEVLAVPVLILSMFSKIEYCTASIAAGASGYMTKESDPKLIVSGLRCIIHGGYVLDSIMIDEVQSTLLAAQDQAPSTYTKELYDSLTSREQEVLRLLAKGRNVKEIAYSLNLAQGTVENYQTTIYRKLEITSPLQLLRLAQELGLI